MGLLSQLLLHPEEIWPLIKMRQAAQEICKLPKDEDLAFCYGMLNDVSRSFAVVIQQLPNPLRDAVCVFYLVLRGLDTVEDDMALPDDIKLPALLAFHKSIYKKGFTMECGTSHYARLMANFGIVVRVFLGLDKVFQDVIADITRHMGEGMAKYIQEDVVTVKQYDEYCFFVAGLVGVGLSQLFAQSGLESEEYMDKEDLSTHMGLLLQKTNIIRDYLEDIEEIPRPRMFWPEEVWGQYADTLEDLKLRDRRQAAVHCLNHMVLDTMRHVPHCVQYMQGLRDVQVFKFCAIPQVMALGTLALCYNNGQVFEGVVKMRRGQTARVFQTCSDLGELLSWFVYFLKQLQAKVNSEVDESDPHKREMQAALAHNITVCNRALKAWRKSGGSLSSSTANVSLGTLLTDYTGLTLAGLYFYLAFDLGAGLPGLVPEGLFAPQYQLVHRILAVLLLLLTLRSAIYLRK